MDTTDRNGAATWLADYADYLRDVVGAATATRVRHLPIVRRFMAACCGPDATDWAGLSVQQVTEFIRQEAAQRTGYGRTALACATRSFPALPGMARCCSKRTRPRRPGHPARTARQPAAAPLLGAAHAAAGACRRTPLGGAP